MAEAAGPLLQVPADTTPTWELEMLVSGAVLVGLFQLPPFIGDAWRASIPRLTSRTTYMLGTEAFGLGLAVVYSLIVSFVVHLGSRAYWVALVGLDSVFPQGIRWERVAQERGIAREELQRTVRPLPRLIARLDNFCSVVFAFGFLAASLAASSLAFIFVGVGLPWLVLLVLPGGHALTLPAAIAVMFILVFVPRFLRRVVLPRLRPGGWTDRVLRAVLPFSADALLLRWFGSLRLTLTSNLRRRVVLSVALVLLIGCFGVAMAQMIMNRGGGEGFVYPGLPASLGNAATEYLYYADQRSGSDAFAPLPFIQSDVVRDPYVRLFIPYVVRRDAPELAACRAKTPVAAGATPDVVAVNCLLVVHAVTLDGRPLGQVEPRFYTDATSRLQGILLYLPVADLARGRHVLTVRQPATPDDPQARPWLSTIPFWL